MTHCNSSPLTFQPLGSREVIAAVDGGKVTSDAGGLLLREIERRYQFVERFAGCLTDHRDPDRIEHTVQELVQQRVFGLCRGDEDLNDHDQLRHDPMLAVLVGKTDPLGARRVSRSDRGKGLAGKSTLNRLELTPAGATAKNRYKKITANVADMQRFLVEAYIVELLREEWPGIEIVVQGDSGSEGTAWVESLLHTLQHEGYERAFESVDTWRTGLRGQKRKAATKLLNYMVERRDMINSPEFVKKGWQIGSGPTEARCKTSTTRLKRSA